MKIFGIVSNNASVILQIRSIANEVFNPEKTRFQSFCYQETNELPDIIHKNPQISAWIFSGETPYHHAEKYIPHNIPAVYCTLNGAEIFRYLLQSLSHSPTHELRLSIDLPQTQVADWRVALEEADISCKHIYMHYYNSYKIDEEACHTVAVHEQHWQKHEIDQVLTSSTKVRQALEKENIPVIQMHGSRFTIVNSLLKLRENRLRQKLIATEVALIRIEIIDIEKRMLAAANSLDFQMQTIHVKEKVLELCQDLYGCYPVEKDAGRWEIFGTRGIIENNTTKMVQKINEIRLKFNIEVNAGIGYGYTAFEAQRNALKAMLYGRQQKPLQLLVAIDREGNVQENLGTNNAAAFPTSITNPDILQRLEKAGVSARSYLRILTLANQLGHDFSAAEIAQQMGVTERNIRRIIKSLLANELVICVGEASLSTRGRPTKKYRMNPKFIQINT